MNKFFLNIDYLFIVFLSICISSCRPDLKTANFTIDGVNTQKYTVEYAGEPNIDDPEQVRIAAINTEVTFKDNSEPAGSAQVWKWYINSDKQSTQDSIFKYTFTQAGTYRVKMVVNQDQGNEVVKIVHIRDLNKAAISVPEKNDLKQVETPNKRTIEPIVSPQPKPSNSLVVYPESPSNIVLASGGELKFRIVASQEWKPEKQAKLPWLNIKKENDMLILTCATNPTSTSRDATVDLKIGKETMSTVSVNQAAAAVPTPSPIVVTVADKEIKKGGKINLAQCNVDNFYLSSGTMTFTPKVHMKLTKLYVNTSNKGKLRIQFGNKKDIVYVNKGKSPIALDDDDLYQTLLPNTSYTITVECEGDIKLSSCIIANKSNDQLTIESGSSVFFNLSYLYK